MISPDWNQTFDSLEKLKAEGFDQEGWYRNHEDTALVVKDGEKWQLFVWNCRDPRPELRRILALNEKTNEIQS